MDLRKEITFKTFNFWLLKMTKPHFSRDQIKTKINFKIPTVSFCQSSAVNFMNLICMRVNSISISIAAQYLHSISNLKFSLTSAKYIQAAVGETIT